MPMTKYPLTAGREPLKTFVEGVLPRLRVNPILSNSHFFRLAPYDRERVTRTLSQAGEERQAMTDFTIRILRSPQPEDLRRCLYLARATQGKFSEVEVPSQEWLEKIIKAGHSPIRTLWWTIEMEGIPYYSSVHFCRHKFGVEHYVQSQRRNPDRGAERQDAPVNHIMDINAQALIQMAHKRLCGKADPTTRQIMRLVCAAVNDVSEYMLPFLVPECGCMESRCNEFKPCGLWRQK